MSGPLLPPTSVLRDAPGVSAAKFMPVFGSDWITGMVMTFCWFTFCVSTIGAWPDTVMLSSTPPTWSSALTAAVNPAESSMPSRFSTLKPVRVKVTV